MAVVTKTYDEPPPPPPPQVTIINPTYIVSQLIPYLKTIPLDKLNSFNTSIKVKSYDELSTILTTEIQTYQYNKDIINKIINIYNQENPKNPAPSNLSLDDILVFIYTAQVKKMILQSGSPTFTPMGTPRTSPVNVPVSGPIYGPQTYTTPSSGPEPPSTPSLSPVYTPSPVFKIFSPKSLPKSLPKSSPIVDLKYKPKSKSKSNSKSNSGPMLIIGIILLVIIFFMMKKKKGGASPVSPIIAKFGKYR
jgi:hypothetical protein